MREIINTIDNNIYKKIGNYKLNQIYFSLISLANIFLITIGLDIGLSLISFGNLPGGDIAGGAGIILQCILIAFRMHHANKPASLSIIVYLISYFMFPGRSILILLIIACIPEGVIQISNVENNIDKSKTIDNTINNISTDNTSTGLQGEQINNTITSVVSNTAITAPAPEEIINHDQRDFIKNILISSLGGIAILGLLLTVGYFTLALFIKGTLLSIVVILLSYILVAFITKRCIKAINIRAQSYGEINNTGSSTFVAYVILPLLLEIAGYVLFFQFFFDKKLWVYSIVIGGIVFFISIVHYLLFWYRVGIRGTQLTLKQDKINESDSGAIHSIIKRRIIRWNVITPILMGAIIIGLPIAFSIYCDNSTGCSFPWRLKWIELFQ